MSRAAWVRSFSLFATAARQRFPCSNCTAADTNHDSVSHSIDAQMSSRIVTLPNVLTIFRMVLIPIFVCLIFYQRFVWALVVFVSAGITDVLGGLLGWPFGHRYD